MRGDNAGLDEQLGFVEGWKKYWRPRLAWAALAGFVVAYDALCPPGMTLSEEVYRQRRSRFGRAVIDRLMDDVTGHLQQTSDEDEDWIHQIAQSRPKRLPLDT